MQDHTEDLDQSVNSADSGFGADLKLLFVKLRCKVPWAVYLEVALILLWAMWIGRVYLNFDPNVWPFGREFGMALHAQLPWSLLTECGDCVLWNGFVNGGYPASVSLHGTFLHPLTIASTLLFGAVNGAKIIILFSLAIAGCAQWWIAKTLGLGRVARVWSAFLAAAGGHLAVKMELGLFPLVFSLASASLVIAVGLQLALTHERRTAVWLGVTTALAVLSGQGYVQLGLLLGPLLSLLVFLIGKKESLISLRKEFAIAALVAVLLAGVFWVPLLHFWSSFGKDVDPTFKSAQAIEYIPLNLVIRDADFFWSEVLGKVPYPYLYGGYIGWWPVLFAILAFRLVPRSGTRTLIFFLLSIGATFLAASGLTFQALAEFLPELAYGVRNPSLIAGLAVPPILGLAAWGLDRLLSWDWPRVSLTPSGGQATKPSLSVRLSWLVLIIPLAWSVRSVADFSQQWLNTTTVPEGQRELVQAMATEGAQWVAPPFGEHFWAPLLAEIVASRPA